MMYAHHIELCGCELDADGKLVRPCPDCAKAAALERTHGPLGKPPSFLQRVADALRGLPRCL
jgi:hypothetical protein